MTGLPKELITGIKSSPSDYPDEHSAKKAALKRFKECMDKGKNDLTASDKDPTDDEEASWSICASPLSLYAHLIRLSAPSIPSVAAAGSASFACAQVEALFEKMASTMLVMSSSNERETTLFLDGPQFSSSAFFGTRITIKEFSTAPKVFNIEIASHQTALNLLATHKDALLAAFEGHKLPFTVNRLDTELHSIEKYAAYRHPDNEDSQDRREDEPS